VSIEELIDLEQQAEFFIVLGQEEAAIDLLVDHLRSTGGGSPMPYLKLLEIYRRRGDREAYERTRALQPPLQRLCARLGRRPAGRPFAGGLPQHRRRGCSMAWPSPIDAMAELESLLFRKTRGELFDMPAYRDVLFLYSLARDLLDREPMDPARRRAAAHQRRRRLHAADVAGRFARARLAPACAAGQPAHGAGRPGRDAAGDARQPVRRRHRPGHRGPPPAPPPPG
jgi:hypothetical protein